MRFAPEAVESVRAAFPRVDVDRVVARAEGRLSLPNANVIDNPAPYLWRICENAETEGKDLRRPSTGGSFKPEGPANVGLSPEGSVLRSEVPVRNEASNFVRFAVREIREQLLTPAEFILVLSKHPETTHKLFRSDVVADWGERDTLDGWASARSRTSLAEIIRSWNGTYPWARDCNLWAEYRERWVARLTKVEEATPAEMGLAP